MGIGILVVFQGLAGARLDIESIDVTVSKTCEDGKTINKPLETFCGKVFCLYSCLSFILFSLSSTWN